MYLRTCRNFMSEKAWVRKSQIHKLQIRKSQKDWVRRSQIRKVPHLRKVRKVPHLRMVHKVPHLWEVRKCNKLLKSANLRVCGSFAVAYFEVFGQLEKKVCAETHKGVEMNKKGVYCVRLSKNGRVLGGGKGLYRGIWKDLQ
jgi:hypothetical protein